MALHDVQGLNSAWQWNKKGIVLPVLRNKVHPYYGVYFPTRFDHLILFDNWLKRYEGPKKASDKTKRNIHLPEEGESRTMGA
ncbi:hypothetical protein [Flammeovirga pectinis]|uniref:hypothetical protein n=1 Tax=Flammeovirga pectinis TaxID=2494373 RepID=UPI00197A92FC|nr:hypothetical protein [Flammeovirga pectinis]